MLKRTKSVRGSPNILITGTPGTGKSRLSQAVAQKTNLTWVDVSKEAVSRGFIEGRDAALDCAVLDEDALLDHLEPRLALGGQLVDYHACELFPERWFDRVFVLTTSTAPLFDRLTARGYSSTKINNNVQCEIFATILEEARESYSEDIVHQLVSDSLLDFERNVQQIVEWVATYEKQKTKSSKRQRSQ